MIAFGKRLYGKIDDVPDYFHVATEFFYVYYLPLIPLRSYIVLKKTGSDFAGVEIPLQLKSVMMAYGVGLLPGVWGIAALSLMAPRAHAISTPLIPVTIAFAAFVSWLVALFFSAKNKASYQRACQLGVISGLSEHGWAGLNRRFGRKGSHPQQT